MVFLGVIFFPIIYPLKRVRERNLIFGIAFGIIYLAIWILLLVVTIQNLIFLNNYFNYLSEDNSHDLANIPNKDWALFLKSSSDKFWPRIWGSLNAGVAFGLILNIYLLYLPALFIYVDENSENGRREKLLCLGWLLTPILIGVWISNLLFFIDEGSKYNDGFRFHELNMMIYEYYESRGLEIPKHAKIWYNSRNWTIGSFGSICSLIYCVICCPLLKAVTG